MQIFEVRAQWDQEAGVWWAESDDVPGLVAEADTRGQLMNDLRYLVPELLQANGRHLEDHAKLRMTWDETEELTFA